MKQQLMTLFVRIEAISGKVLSAHTKLNEAIVRTRKEKVLAFIMKTEHARPSPEGGLKLSPFSAMTKDEEIIVEENIGLSFKKGPLLKKSQ